MIGVVALGFLAGAGVSRRRPVIRDRRSAELKKTGASGLLMTGAMWLIRQQLGNPAQLAQLIMSKVNAMREKKSSARAPYQSPPGTYKSSPSDRPFYR
jgi:hypothetical protein